MLAGNLLTGWLSVVSSGHLHLYEEFIKESFRRIISIRFIYLWTGNKMIKMQIKYIVLILEAPVKYTAEGANKGNKMFNPWIEWIKCFISELVTMQLFGRCISTQTKDSLHCLMYECMTAHYIFLLLGFWRLWWYSFCMAENTVHEHINQQKNTSLRLLEVPFHVTCTAFCLFILCKVGSRKVVMLV